MLLDLFYLCHFYLIQLVICYESMKAIGMEFSTGQFNAMRGIIRRALLMQFGPRDMSFGPQGTIDQKLQTQILNGFRRNLGGFGHEKAFVEAFNSLSKFLNAQAFQTQGNLVDKKESVYDIVISLSENTSNKLAANQDNYFSNLLAGLEKNFSAKTFEGSISKDEILALKKDADAVYGVQVKRGWTLPEKEPQKLNNLFYSLGTRSQLLNSLGGGVLTSYSGAEYKDPPGYRRGWHNAVYLASTAIFKILGKYQLLFQLKNDVVWTFKLLQMMKDYKLWLTFYFKRSQGVFYYPATRHALMQKAKKK